MNLKYFLKIKRGKSLEGKYYSNEGEIIRLTLANFFEKGGFKDSNLNRNVFYKGSIKDIDLLKKNTIITPLTEQVKGLLGSMAYIPESNKYVACGDIGIVESIDKTKFSEKFIYHLFKWEYIRNQLVRNAQKSKIRHISPNDFYNIEYDIPSLKNQNKISYILDLIDQKIELNNKINDNLVNLQ